MSAPSVWSVIAVVAGASSIAGIRRWLVAERTLRRLGPTPSPSAAATQPVPAVVERALAAAGTPAQHHATLLRCWLGGAAAALGSIAFMPSGPVVAGVAVLGPPAVVLLCSGRAARLRNRSLPLALDAIVAALRAGHSLGSSISETAAHDGTGPVALELAGVARDAGVGVPLGQAIERWSHRHPDVGTRLAAASLAVAAEVGGPGAEAVEAAATSLRDRAAIDDEIAALSVQARASAALLALTPIGFTLLLTTVDPASARFLLGSGVGWLCLAVGLGLDAAGALWMHRLVRSAR